MTIFFNGLPSRKTKVFPWFSAFQILEYRKGKGLVHQLPQFMDLIERIFIRA